MSEAFKVIVSSNKLIATIRVTGMEFPTKEEVMQALEKNNVVYGVYGDVVDLVASTIIKDLTIIAKGDPPVPGKNGWVEIFWGKKQDGQDADEEVARLIDFRETSHLISVNEGTLLAQTHPPEEGKPGKAVTGVEIPPPKPKEAVLIAGKGVRLDDNGDKAYSLIQGMPLIKKTAGNYIISIKPFYTVTGDINLKTGNIRFKGDVTVTGNISENMILEASGDVKVYGLVTGAKVFCGKSLKVLGNIISSSITAGMGSVECGKIKYLIEDIYNDLSMVVQSMEQLKGKHMNIEKIPFSQVVNGLIENRFRNIRVNARQLTGTKAFLLPQEVAEAVETVKIITGVQFSQEDFKEMMHHLAQAVNYMTSQDAKKVKVSMNSAFMSTIKCSGEVIVTGKGCVNTTIVAGGDVKITGPFKGGEIFSEGDVEINELGSNLGAPPLVRVKSKNVVKIKKALPGCIIQIGHNRVNLTKEISAAKYKLGKDGEIEIV